MSNCNLDHSLEDVKNKLTQQREFLPYDVSQKLELLLDQDLDQPTLNEVFHLLKKYDLASEDERELRNEKILALFRKLSK